MFGKTLKTLAPLRVKLISTRPNIENLLFKLHFLYTVCILALFVVLVCTREYYGEHIKCMNDKGVEESVIGTYCFVMGTFTIVKYYNESMLHGDEPYIPHPGVSAYSSKNDKVFHHSFYQWVPFLLFIQAVCFYMPHYIWKKQEGGRLKLLADGLQYAIMAGDEDVTYNKITVPSKQKLETKLKNIAKDILLRLRISKTWSIWLVSMEITNLLHIILQIWVTDLFLNGEFISLGPKIMNHEKWDTIISPLTHIFPKVTKCTFRKIGAGGGIQNHDAMCVMSLNIIHEKIFTLLWFWFLFVLITSALAVIWRIVSIYLYLYWPCFTRLMLWRACGNRLDARSVDLVVKHCWYGDWLFLYYLAKNMPICVFPTVFAKIAEALEKQQNCDGKTLEAKSGLGPAFVDKLGYNNEMYLHDNGKKS